MKLVPIHILSSVVPIPNNYSINTEYILFYILYSVFCGIKSIQYDKIIELKLYSPHIYNKQIKNKFIIYIYEIYEQRS